MTYVEKKAMKIMREMAYNYGNQPEVVQTIRQIIADTKRASYGAVEETYSNSALRPFLYNYKEAIDQVEVKGE